MVLRRAVPSTSTRLLSRYAANSNAKACAIRSGSGVADVARLIPASSALLHRSSSSLRDEHVSAMLPRVQVNHRGFASAMQAEAAAADTVSSSSGKTLRYFRPVEKLANGVAIIRWVYLRSICTALSLGVCVFCFVALLGLSCLLRYTQCDLHCADSSCCCGTLVKYYDTLPFAPTAFSNLFFSRVGVTCDLSRVISAFL